MIEQRSAPRRRILKSDTIEFAGGRIECTVQDISKLGAAVEVTTQALIPDHFTLYLHSDKLKSSSDHDGSSGGARSGGASARDGRIAPPDL